MPDFNLDNFSDTALNKAIDRLLERAEKPELPRVYLGASIIGDDCMRRIQYEWCCRPDLPTRVKRIFSRGHFFGLMREQLRTAGFRFSGNPADLEFTAFDGAFAGHADGLILSGPELPGIVYPALWEAKALNAKGWRSVERDGVAKAYPEYHAQISTYQLHLKQLNPCLFTAVNADTCELLNIAVPFYPDAANYWTDRARMIIEATRNSELLPRFTTNSSDWRCKICPHKERCWR